MAHKKWAKTRCSECGASNHCIHKRRRNHQTWSELHRDSFARYRATYLAKHGRSAAGAYQRWAYIKCLYGLTKDDYNNMLAEQQGGCALCSKKNETLVIDHDHKTNKVRGLVCRRCNLSLSLIDELDDWERVIKEHLRRG